MELDRSELARRLAQLPRKAKDKTCEECGQSFMGKGRGKYCSPACRSRAFRKRRKAPVAHIAGSVDEIINQFATPPASPGQEDAGG